METESTTQNDEATHSAQESEKLMVKQEENADAAVTDNLAEELPPREHPEPAETSSAVPDTSGKSNEKTLETTESIQISSVEGSLKQEELDFIEPEKEVSIHIQTLSFYELVLQFPYLSCKSLHWTDKRLGHRRQNTD